MNDSKFQLALITVVRLMLDFRKLSDKSDRRVMSDVIRALVKEMTRP